MAPFRVASLRLALTLTAPSAWSRKDLVIPKLGAAVAPWKAIAL
jgi:hypothetical protein